MFRILTIALTFYLPFAVADDGFVLDDSKYYAVNHLKEGRYYTDYGYLVNPSITQWADEYVMDGLIGYGNQKYRFQANLSQFTKTGKVNLFKGDGLIEQVWTSGHVCTYRMKVEVLSFEDGNGTPTLFLKHFSPESLYTTWNVIQLGCPPAAAASSWRVSKDPYILGR